MAKISKHINLPNQHIHFNDKTGKMIVTLGGNNGKSNEIWSCQLTGIHNLLIIRILDTPEMYLSKVDLKSDMEKYVHFQ